jgi:hypothetical protein
MASILGSVFSAVPGLLGYAAQSAGQGQQGHRGLLDFIQDPTGDDSMKRQLMALQLADLQAKQEGRSAAIAQFQPHSQAGLLGGPRQDGQGLLNMPGASIPGLTPDMSAALAKMSPETAMSAMVKDTSPVKLGEGESLFRPDGKGGYSPVAQGGEKLPPGFIRGPDGGMVASPGWLQAETALRMAGKPITNMNMPPAEKAEDVAYGTAMGTAAAGVHAGARGAENQLAQLDRLDALMQQAQTGRLAPAMSTASAWGQALGMDPDTLKKIGVDPNAAMVGEGFSSIANKMVTGMIGSGGFPANNFSDADRKFLTQTMPQLGTTPAGNQMIMQAMRSEAERNITKERMWLDAKKQGKTYADFQGDWNRHVQSTPVFPRPKTPQEAAGLKPGTIFIGPDGTPRMVPMQ